MEVNKEEALRCLGIAQRHRNAQNYPSALKFARKSVTMYSTAEGEKMVRIIEEEMTSYSEKPAAPAASGSSSSAKASGVEEHVTSARQRHPAAEKREEKTEKKQEKRQYTAKQIEVVTRVKRCGHTAYYQILSSECLKVADGDRRIRSGALRATFCFQTLGIMLVAGRDRTGTER